MLVEAIVPLKSLAASKYRLSGVLSCVDRRNLVMAMANDVLSRLASHPEINIVSVVLGGGWQIDFFDRYRASDRERSTGERVASNCALTRSKPRSISFDRANGRRSRCEQRSCWR